MRDEIFLSSLTSSRDETVLALDDGHPASRGATPAEGAGAGRDSAERAAAMPAGPSAHQALARRGPFPSTALRRPWAGDAEGSATSPIQTDASEAGIRLPAAWPSLPGNAPGPSVLGAGTPGAVLTAETPWPPRVANAPSGPARPSASAAGGAQGPAAQSYRIPPAANATANFTASGPATASSANHPSANAALEFTLTKPVPIGEELTWALPSVFYQSLHQTFSVGAGGFSASAYVDVAGGIKASATLSLGTILPDYNLTVNAETVGYVQDGNVFTVSPTLISTDDAQFSLGLPTAVLDAAFGLAGKAGISLDFPSVSVGFSVFGHFIGYTLAPPPISKSFSAGAIEKLPADKSVNFPGGYATVSTLPASTYTTTGTSQHYGIPILTTHAYTKPILQANLDVLGAIAQYVPELQALDGSKDFGIGSATWSLLSLPLQASLELENSSTITELGFSAHLTENYGGNSVDRGTRQVTIGTQAGGQWQLLSPSSGGGVIDLELDYALTLGVQSTISLAGSFGLNLDGPQALVTLFGHDFGISPLFSVPFLNKSGSLINITSTSNTLTLTATEHQLVFYGPKVVPQTLVNSLNMSYQLKAGGEVFVIPKGLFIAPSTATAGSQFGVVGTLGAGAVYNYGFIYATPKSGTISAGIQLLGGGKVINAGNINSSSGGGGHFTGSVTYGIELGGNHSTIINSGRIANSTKAEIKAYGSGSVYVYNKATGLIIGGSQDGISSSTARLNVHNDGSIATNNAFGIYARGGLLLANSATGYIGGGASAHTLSPIPAASVFGGGNSFVRNDGFINVSTSGSHAIGSGRIGIDLGSGGDVQNTGTIGGQLVGVRLGAYDNYGTYLINSGLIETASTAAGAAAVNLLGAKNSLGLRPGARFQGAVIASAAYGPQNNQILLGGTSGIGTLSMLNAASFQNFGYIRPNGQGAAWLLQTTASFGFGGATISGLGSTDRIELVGLGFQYGDQARYNAAAHQLYLTGSDGSTLSTINFEVTPGALNFHVFGSGANTYIREYKDNFTNIVTGKIGPQTVDANSYYGGRLTVASAGLIGSVPGSPADIGLRLNPVYGQRTTTVQGTLTTRTALIPAQVTNHGLINGASKAIDLETAGTISNPDGTIASSIMGVYQPGTLSAAFLGNSSLIDGRTQAVALGNGATIVNTGHGNLTSYGLGVAVGAGSAVYNSHLIEGTGTGGIELGAGSVLINAVGTTLPGGQIRGGGFGVLGLGAGVTVANAGYITGTVGVTLSAGGVVSNYQTTNGGVVLGGIKGSTYGVVITGGAGTVANEIGTLATAPAHGTISGVSLGAGGVIFNGKYGIIGGNGQYAVRLGSAGATLGNSGQIGRVGATGGDAIFNAAGGTLAAITGQTMAAGGTLSISNEGIIGRGGNAGAGISSAVSVYIQNAGTIQGGGSPAIVLRGGGTIATSGAILGGAGAAPIDFGTAAATLVLKPGASFSGNVTANSADTLVLGGTSTATLSGLGTAFAQFGSYQVAAGATWSLAGASTLAANWAIGGTLVTGNGAGLYHGVSITGSATVTGAMLGANATASPGATGHYRGAAGAEVSPGGRLTNTGLIAGGYGAHYGAGGDGVDVDDSTLVNSGTIAGGSFQAAQSSGNGGIGVKLAAGSLGNAGTLRGGDALNVNASYGAGGIGLLIYGGATATNSGTITGGAGTRRAGYGVAIIRGMLTNTGRITGGTGAGSGTSAAGVYLVGGTLITSGTIAGGGSAAAIRFGTYAATLQINAGAKFIGAVAATRADDLLVLGTGKPGTLSGLGRNITGFTHITETAQANWTLAGNSTLATGAILTSAGTLAVAGILRNQGTIAASPATAAGYGGVTLASGTLLNLGVILGGRGADGNAAGSGGIGVTVSSGTLSNGGTIAGGAGGVSPIYAGGNGGDGVAVAAGGVLTSTGAIVGGGAAANLHGGAGVRLDGGTLGNSGTITGGAGYNSGGAGARLASGTLGSSGTITGGAGYITGGAGLYIGQGVATNSGLIAGGAATAYGGYGAIVKGGTLLNTGRILGGTGGLRHAAGVYLGGGTLITSGTIAGGGPGAAAVRFGVQAATLQINAGAKFSGAIAATRADDLLVLGTGKSATLTGLGGSISGFAQISELAGGNWTLAGASTLAAGATLTTRGTLAVAGTLANAGVIAASGAAPQAGSPGYGGVTLASGALINTGFIIGGKGQFGGGAGKGGDGVTVRAGTLSNSGTIAGGVGGYSNYYFGNGNGGSGVSLGARSVLTNTGSIVGGGLGDTQHGGVGVTATGATITNSGTISGGAAYGGAGAGVYLNGGTLTNSGLIAGGSVNGTTANAITFGPTAATLVITTGARFQGVVAANTAVNDTLRLTGSGGTLSGLGSAFTGFSTVSAGSGAAWTLAGTETFSGTLAGPGALKLAGTLTGSGVITLATGSRLAATGLIGTALTNLGTITVGKGTLTLGASASGAGSIVLGSLSTLALAGSGTLATGLSGPGRLRVDGAWSAATSVLAPAALQIGSTGALRSTGTLTLATTNDGSLLAAGGTLAIATTIAGTGTLGADAGATLLLSTGGALTEAVAGAGTLVLQNTWAATSAPISIASLTVAAGGTLSATGTIGSALLDSGTVLAGAGTLTLSGVLSGAGSLAAGAGGQLVLSGGGTFAGTIGGAGEIDLAAALTFGNGAALTAARVVDTANIVLAAGETLSTAATTSLQITAATTLSITGSTASKLVNAGQLLSNGTSKTTIGLSFLNTGTIVNGGGTLLLSRGVTNTGLVEVDQGVITSSGSVAGAGGTFAIGAGGTLALAAVGAGQNVAFLSNAGKLNLSDPLHFLGTISGFAGAASIDLLATPADGLSYANGVLTVTKAGTTVASLHLQGSYTSASFSLIADGHGGDFIRLT